MLFDLSIIIVNYKQPDFLIDCINSITKTIKQYSYEIIVVNNDKDDTLPMLNNASNIRVIHTLENIGFSKANNIGIKQSNGELLLLLNSDTIVLDDAIDTSVSLFKESNLVACGVQLLNADYTFQHSGRHFTPKNLGMILKYPYIKNLHEILTSSVSKNHHEIITEDKKYKPVDWINGAFLMVKKEVLQTAGYLDEEFFLYSEETEWCYRIGKKAGGLGIFPQAKVIHFQGESATKTFKTQQKGYFDISTNLAKQILVSEFLRTKKQFGKIWVALIYALGFVYLPLIFFIWTCDALLNKENKMYSFKQVVSFARNFFSVGGYCFRMLFSSEYFFYKVI